MQKQLHSFNFTYNNYPESALEAVQGALHPISKYFVFGKEVGESGTPHLQGFCQLKKKVSFNVIRKMFPWHVEPTRSNDLSQKYCQKDGNFIEFGVYSSPSSGSVSSQERWADILHLAQSGQWDNLSSKYPGEFVRSHTSLHRVRVEAMSPLSCVKKCYWFWGKPGTGKSRMAHSVTNNVAYFKNPNKWWDNYKAEKDVVIDDFGTEHSVLGYHLKRWADRYPVLCETKGSAIYPSFDRLFITSNYSPEQVFGVNEVMSEAIKRRFHVMLFMSCEESLEGELRVKTSTDGNIINIITNLSFD